MVIKTMPQLRTCVALAPWVRQTAAPDRSGFNVALALGLLVAVVGQSSAQASCKSSLSTETVNNFIGHPSKFADRLPQGGPYFLYSIMAFATFNRATLTGVMTVLRTANPVQKRDIGRALSYAVTACLARDGEIAREIADALKQSGDTRVIDSYLVASDNGNDAPAPAPEDYSSTSNSLRILPGQNLSISPIESSRLPLNGNLFQAH